MQENGKRLLSFLLVVAMVFSMLPMSAFAQELEEEQQVTTNQVQSEETEPEATLPQVVAPEETLPEEPEAVTRPATKNETGEEYPQLIFDEPLVMDFTEPGATWISFTPEESGVYSFCFRSEETFGVHIYDYNKEYQQNSAFQGSLEMFQQMEGGKTYYLTVDPHVSGNTTITITAGYSPLESITFQPITILEGTIGNVVKDAETQQLWYRYTPAIRMSYTATFVDGTVVTGEEPRIHYNGNEYGIDSYDDQAYNNQWTAGNTYTFTVRAMGHEVSIPVTVEKSTIESISISPVTVIEKTCGYYMDSWNPETETHDLRYYYYSHYDVLSGASYKITHEDGTEEHDKGSLVFYEDQLYSMEAYTDQSYENQWTAGNTYTMEVFILGQHVQVPVSIIASPLESLVFEPIVIEEGTCGDVLETERGSYYYYYPWDLFYKTSYTVTFTDGTVLTSGQNEIYYNGSWYSMACGSDQSYENQWIAGNTYAIEVEFMGQMFQVPVTIQKSQIPALELDVPVSVTISGGESKNYAELLFTPDEDGVYIFTSISDIDTYGNLYEVVIGDTPEIAHDDDGGDDYNFQIMANLLAGHTYKLQVRHVNWEPCTFQVKVSGNPLQSITFAPITIMEGDCTSVSSDWDENTGMYKPYLQYYPWDLFYKTSYTATFADGQVVSGNQGEIFYNGSYYSMSCTTNQSYQNQWTAGNTYALKVTFMGQTVEVPVTITPSPVESMTVQPVTIVEGTCGTISHAYNPETGNYDREYYYYYPSSVLGKTTYTLNFTDGSSWSGSGNEGYHYNGQVYWLDSHVNQNYDKKWTAGNTYTIDAFFMGKHVQVPVTIVPSPVVSITAEPVTMYEGVGGNWNSYWPGDGNEYQYYAYHWWNKVAYTITFNDGSTATVSNGNGYEYNGSYYSMSYQDSQGSEDQWTVGNTYTGKISFMGATTEVSVTIEPSPVESVVFDPITLEENTEGYWTWDEGVEYYRYDYWRYQIAYTVTFRDGTVARGTYWDDVEYDGTWYGVTTYEDTQSGENPWLVGNTYGVRIQFEGTWYDGYVTITRTTEDNGFTYIPQGDKAIINGCTMQTEILQIPETIDGYQVIGITSLGDALAYAQELRIPDSVTMLSEYVFNPYGSMIPLKKLVLGKGVTTLSAFMLRNAWELEQIVVAAGNPSLCSIDGVVYSKDITTLIAYPAAKQELHKMPDSVTDVSALFEEVEYSRINVQFGAGVKDYKLAGGIIYNADMTEVVKATSAATGSYVMPETVTDIASYAFTGSNLTSIAVSPSVTYLSYASFYEAINLEEISVPTSVTAISGYFSTCENLKKVHIADVSAWCNVEGGGGLLYRAHDLYLNGEKIVDLVIPETVTEGVYNTDSIAWEAFAYGSFESVTIPSRIKYIDWDAFYGCENLKKVNISDLSAWCEIQFQNGQANPLYYGKNLYLNGEKVTDLVIPETVSTKVYGVGDYAFYNANIESLTVPSFVYNIGGWAFYGSSVEEVIIEEGLDSIYLAAFADSAVKSVDLPDSLTYMAPEVFNGCKNLEKVTFGSGLDAIPSYSFQNTALKSVTIPKQVTYVGSEAFANSQLTEVTFLCDAVQIGWRAFRDCPLGDLKLGDNITYIEEEGFNGISATRIQHPASVTEISYRVYALNPNLVSVTIPDTVQYISDFAFEGDSNLSHVLYTGTQEQWDKLEVYSRELNKATIHYDATGNEVTTEQNCTTIRMFCTICGEWETVYKKNAVHTFENGVCTVCGYEGFWAYEEENGTAIITGYLGNDTDVEVPEEIDGLTVKTFTEDVFSYNRKLTSVTLPDSITEIPEGAFRNCTALKTVTLGKNVTVIGEEAFLDNWSLTAVNLPEGLTTIGAAAFCRCFELEVTVPKSVRTIGAMAFYDCNQLERVEIPAGVTEISYEAFASCWNLEELILPDTVTTIGYYAFSGAGIQELIVPASVEKICSDAFYMNNLKTVVFQGNMPQMDNAFDHSGVSMFYAASNKTWKDIALPGDNNSWYACKVPTITKQPANQTVLPGEQVTLSAEGYGHRLSYQWYYAAPNAKKFTPVGGDRIELTLTVDKDTSGARAYCVVTDLLGQTAKTDTVTLKNPTKSTGIRLNQLPYTLEYDLRQALRTRGLEVVLTYDDGTEDPVFDYTVTGYDPNVGGVQTITVAYDGYTATFQVTVNEEKLNFTNDQQQIELSVPEGAVEQDVELVVETVYPEQALPEIPEMPEILQENEAVIFDITLEKGGEQVQPTAPVQVSIPVPAHMESKRCKVFHIADDGEATDMNARYKDGRMVFDTGHFSYYAVVETSSGVAVSGTVIGSDVTGTVVRLLSGGEVLESMSVTTNGTYLFENVVSNDYVIEVVKEGMVTVTETITVTDEDVVKDILFQYVAVAADSQQTNYNTLIQAVENAPAGSTLKLFGNFADSVTVTKEITLDLNGFELTGDITVASGAKLLVKDSQTDDYTVNDAAGYGKLTGTVTGVQAAEGYMLIAEEAGVSFHRIDLTLTDMTLRPSEVGVYYKSNFAGDELVAQKVARYGVALSVQGVPAEDALGIMSWFDDFAPGAEANTANGTLLHGIMKTTNTEAVNAENANIPVYGRAYVLTTDGQYIFGESVSRSLRQQVELIDGMWDQLTAIQQTTIGAMYEAYQSVMENWNIPNIKSVK